MDTRIVVDEFASLDEEFLEGLAESINLVKRLSGETTDGKANTDSTDTVD